MNITVGYCVATFEEAMYSPFPCSKLMRSTVQRDPQAMVEICSRPDCLRNADSARSRLFECLVAVGIDSPEKARAEACIPSLAPWPPSCVRTLRARIHETRSFIIARRACTRRRVMAASWRWARTEPVGCSASCHGVRSCDPHVGASLLHLIRLRRGGAFAQVMQWSSQSRLLSAQAELVDPEIFCSACAKQLLAGHDRHSSVGGLVSFVNGSACDLSLLESPFELAQTAPKPGPWCKSVSKPGDRDCAAEARARSAQPDARTRAR
jgi:hypothetical protein